MGGGQNHHMCLPTLSLADGDDLKDVIDYLDEVAGRWETISRNLRIKTGKINELVYSRQTPLNCLANAITDWLLLNYNHQRFGKPSWKKVAESVVKVNRKLFLRIALEHKAKGELFNNYTCKAYTTIGVGL